MNNTGQWYMYEYHGFLYRIHALFRESVQLCQRMYIRVIEISMTRI